MIDKVQLKSKMNLVAMEIPTNSISIKRTVTLVAATDSLLTVLRLSLELESKTIIIKAMIPMAVRKSGEKETNFCPWNVNKEMMRPAKMRIKTLEILSLLET